MQKELAEVGNYKTEGRIINEVRFADDTAIIVKIKEELQDMVNRLVDIGRKYDMKINIDINTSNEGIPRKLTITN